MQRGRVCEGVARMLRMAARAAHLPRNLHRGREKMNVLCRIGMVPGPASREARLSQVMVVYQEKRGYLGFVPGALSSAKSLQVFHPCPIFRCCIRYATAAAIRFCRANSFKQREGVSVRGREGKIKN